MIISLTCLLISDPIIYSDSEAYKDYIQMRKQAEDSLYKVIIILICFSIIINYFLGNLQGNKKIAALEFSKCLEIFGRPIWTSRKKLWASLIWQIIRQFLHQFKTFVLLKKWNNAIFKTA